MKKILKVILSRRVLIITSLALQILVFFWMAWSSSESSIIIENILSVISIIVGISIIHSDVKPGYKLIWCTLILMVPIFGGLFYLLFKFQGYGGKLYKNIRRLEIIPNPLLQQDMEVYDAFSTEMPEHLTQMNYIKNISGFPIYRNTDVEYLSPGEIKFKRLVSELEKAEHFIFFEYFIIEEGYMWNTILDILEKKKKSGVDVRVMYDDIGCLTHLPGNYYKEVEKRGIPCVVFNDFRPVWSSDQNNRDHRKIAVIDGNVGFTGGINVADEYINYPPADSDITAGPRWKDASVMLRGDAVWSLTVMFLQLWNVYRPTETIGDFEKYKPHTPVLSSAKGFVQPYGDSPVDNEDVVETIYFQMINNAQKYLYIVSPYLIVDDNILSSLCIAAKRGVDVKIITPGVPDKKLVHATTRTYYAPLCKAGVKIYEYTPGFIHSKIIIYDDSIASIGTANLDYRSFCMSFECGTMLYGSEEALADIKNDFLSTLEKSKEITAESLKSNIFKRIFDIILRAIAPLL